MMRRAALALILATAFTVPLRAQVGGAMAGKVTDAGTGQPLADVRVEVDGQQRVATTDSAGLFRLREVPAGWQRVRFLHIGYRPVRRDSVLVRAGETVMLSPSLQRTRDIDTLSALEVTTTPDIVLDPMMTATTQRITGDEIRKLPVSTVDEAVALTAGTVGSSYRGGRAGQESFIIDGLSVKNQLDASTGGLGLRVPVDMLTEASLVTNGFSARYGQALSGLINVDTKDGGDVWNGRAAYETDRGAPSGWDYGLDRFVLSGDGPLPAGIKLSFAADITGRLDADPVNAPAPTDTLDPRIARPNLLPHNSGETYDFAAKLRFPLGTHNTIRLFGLSSTQQQLLFDPALKYAEQFAPAQRVTGSLITGHWQYASSSRNSHSLVSDFRVSAFSRDFVRGPLASTPPDRFGGFTFDRFHVVGEDVARRQDTIAARSAIPGYTVADSADNTPWGVPAFFLGDGGRGDLAWNHFNEVRAQLDLNFGGRDADFWGGFEVVQQHVQTFQRVAAGLPVGGLVPDPSAADFKPRMFAGYGETQLRWQELAFTLGARLDQFNPHTTTPGTQPGGRTYISPRFAVSTVLHNATFVVSYGRFAQAPDYQYLVDAAFDDTSRTGRFRTGNPNLGYEQSNQYELSIRARPQPGLSLRLNVYVKKLEGLVASVPFGTNPDSSIFGNIDYGDVKGIEGLFEKEYTNGLGFRIMATVQTAQATATNAYQLYRSIHVEPTGDTVVSGDVEFPLDFDRRLGVTAIFFSKIRPGVLRSGSFDVLGGLEASAIVRYSSGLPYSRTNSAGDSIIGLPNSARLPSQYQLDMLIRRPLRLGRVRGSLYLDLRNLTNRQNLVAVRKDTGSPGLGASGLDSVATLAYNVHPEPIPYESPRYRAWADLNGDGVIAGQAELLPLYRRAAQDFFQPLFAYGPPRLIRFGFEITF
ncbi:MAG TPA: TonB-dependent receptor [Gemmatimonadales bacterium]|jgi:outer membrane receptor protein involved in Fe transport